MSNAPVLSRVLRAAARPVTMCGILLLVHVTAASAQPPVRIMPLGDSITQGQNDTVPASGPVGYRGVLWNQLVSDGFSVDFVGTLADGPATIDRNHEGHGGFRIDEITAGIDGYLAAASPDLILLHIGTNDLLQGIAPDQAAQRLGALLDRIHQVRPSAHVIVASIIPVRNPNVFNVDPQLFSDYVWYIPALVGERAALGWPISHLDMATLVGMTSSDYDSAGIHPTDAAYARMAAVWHSEIANRLDGNAPPTIGVTYPYDKSTVYGLVTLSANAFDDVGVTDVTFSIDGVPIVTDTTAPYQTAWNSALASDGPHTLLATARDGGGQTRSQIVHFATANQLLVPPLIAAFGFEEAGGATALDGSGRNNNASLIGVSRTALGHTGNAVTLNGSTGHLEIAYPAADLGFTTAFTISGWVNPTTVASGWHMIVSRQLGTGSADSWFLAQNGATVYFAAGGVVTGGLAAGQWTHVAAVKNGATLQLYLNGSLAATVSNATSPVPTDANEVGIGAGNNGAPLWGEVFDGRLDDLRFYAEARSAAQIQTDMTTPVGSAPDTVPPVISNVAVAASDVTATVTWTTDEASTSQVDYGPTTGYGTTTPLDTTLVTSHTVTLTGLTANTPYHYRVRSHDANLNEQVSGDGAFTTSDAVVLVAAYGFEEASGTQAVDSAGGDQPGTLVGTVARTAGRFGQGLTLDGSPDGMTVADTPALNPGTGAFTVSVWARTSTTALQRILGKRAVCTTHVGFWDLLVLPSGVAAAEIDDTAGNYGAAVGTRVVTDGAWHFLTLVRNGTTVQVYVDGTLDGSGTSGAVAPTVSNTAPVEMSTLCNDGPFIGQLDEVRYHQGALSPSQIQAVMGTGIVAPASALVAAYNFDAGSGGTVTDVSGRGNTLVLTNTSWAPQGHTNGALSFNGTSSRAELPSPAADLGFTTAFTISGWVNPTTVASGWHMIVSRQLGTGSADSWFLAQNGATVYFAAGGVVTGGLAAGQWTHVAAVKNGATLQLYLNGSLAATVSNATSPVPTDANEVGIGAGNNGAPLWGEVFDGRLDDLRFYAEARSAAQIQTDMTTPVGSAPDTVPPVISNVAVAASDVTATVTWTTDEASTSQVDYGPTTGYGTTTPLDTTLVTSHTVTLTGLTANTPYHYRVRSHDANLNEQVSGDGAFTTSDAVVLVAAYGFEEASGTQAVDSAGGDQPGTLVGTVARTAGRFGQGLTLDGSPDGMTVADTPALNPGTGAFTVSVWARTSTTALQRILGKRAVCTTHVGFWDLLVLPSGVAAAEIDDTAGNYGAAVGTRVVTDGAWHFLTLVRNGTTVQVYVDGTLDGSGTSGAVAPTVSNTAPVEMSTLCNDGPFIGQLDEVRYHQGALSPSQIQAVMGTGIVAPASALVAAYNFDAGSGGTVTDVSGRGNTLVLTNTSWAPQGHTNGALSFNGTSSRAELPSPAADLGFTTAFTISGWVNPTTVASGWHMIVSRQLGTGSADSWFLAQNGATVYFAAGGVVTGGLAAGQWTHVAAVKNGATLQLYLNGSLAATVSNATSPVPTDANEVGIGAGNNGAPLWGEVFDGRLDDLRFYAEARSAAQIQTDMTTPVP